MRERVVVERVGMGQQGGAGSVDGLDAVLTEDSSGPDVQPGTDGWEVSFGVELNRIDPIGIGWPLLAVSWLSRSPRATVKR